MYDFFQILPIRVGAIARDVALLVIGPGIGLGRPRRVGVRADLPDPLKRRHASGHVYPRAGTERRIGVRGFPHVAAAARPIGAGGPATPR